MNLLPEFTKICFKGLLNLFGYLVHLRHIWQNGVNDKGPSMGSRIKRFEYRKFPLSGKWNCSQFCKINTSHGNTIEDLANMMVFLLIRNFISFHTKTWSVFVSKEIIQWPSGTVLPGFDHMLTSHDLDLGLRNGSALGKVPSSNLRKLLKYL